MPATSPPPSSPNNNHHHRPGTDAEDPQDTIDIMAESPSKWGALRRFTQK